MCQANPCPDSGASAYAGDQPDSGSIADALADSHSDGSARSYATGTCEHGAGTPMILAGSYVIFYWLTIGELLL